MEAIEDTLSKNAIKVLKARYLIKSSDGTQETPRQMFFRVAQAIGSADTKYGDFNPEDSTQIFFDMMMRLDFLPNSPTLMNAGATLGQLSACFVLPVEDNTNSILDAVKTQAIVQKTGGGTGFAFSQLRPEGDEVGTTGSVASGPVSFMQLFDKCTQVIKQGGKRRGANMGILSIDHPDVIEFIEMKKNNIRIPDQAKIMKEFNVSVAITDKFMTEVENDEYHQFINPRTEKEVLKCDQCRKNVFPVEASIGEAICSLCNGKGVRTKARDMWNKIVESAWLCADPGLIFIDKINRSLSNPLRKYYEIEATNPCGEVPLLPNESCNLGSINVGNFITTTGESDVDWTRLGECVKNAIHFLDNVVTINKYPTQEIEERSRGMRRLGLGVMGFADLLNRIGIRYGSDESFNIAGRLMKFISDEAWKMSEELAKTRETFPYWDKSEFAEKGKIVRNVNCTIIAPTGSIGTIANCSPGIEPHYALVFTRHSRIKERSEEFEDLYYLNEDFAKTIKERGIPLTKTRIDEISKNGGSIRGIMWIPQDIQDYFSIAADVTLEEHVLMQSAFQEFVDDGVSKTINLPNEATVEDVGKAYLLAYQTYCKGITIYRDGSLDVQVLETEKTKVDRAAFDASYDRKVSHIPEGYSRPEYLEGRTYRFTYNNSGLFITVNKDQQEKVREVFIERGKSGDEEKAAYEAMGRTVSIALQKGVEVKEMIKTLRGIQTRNVSWHKTKDGSIPLRSVPDAVAHALAQSIHQELPTKDTGEKCPTCEEYAFIHTESCNKCLVCGFSDCT